MTNLPKEGFSLGRYFYQSIQEVCLICSVDLSTAAIHLKLWMLGSREARVTVLL